MHILGQRSFEFDLFFGCGVFEFERMGVQGDTVNDGLLNDRFFVGKLPGIYEFAAIHIVGDNWMLDRGKVHTYLVCSSGFGGQFEQ